MQGMRCLEKPRDWQYREERSQQPHVLSYLHACSPSGPENSGFYAETPISTFVFRKTIPPPFSHVKRGWAAGGRRILLSRGCERALWGGKLPERMGEPHPCEKRKSAAPKLQNHSEAGTAW